MTDAVNLLVVDDEEAVCHACARIFRHQGCQVHTTTDPHEGLRLAKAGNFDAVVLDVRMPELSGIEFLRILRETHPALPVILITAYTSLSSAAEAVRLQAANILGKPFSDQELLEALVTVVPRAAPLARPGAPSAPALPVSAPHAWTPGPGGCVFLDTAWLRLGTDGTARVGAFLPRAEARAAETLHVARPGEVVHRGLPLAQVSGPGRRPRVVPSPVTGEVLEVNAALTAERHLLWTAPCQDGWLARVRPHQPSPGRPRCLVLINPADMRAAPQQRALEELGCQVNVVASLAAALQTLRATRSDVVVLDTVALGSQGPEVAASLHHAVPRARVVAWQDAGTPPDGAYRGEHLVTYVDQEGGQGALIDVLDSVFRAPRRAAAARPVNPLPTSLRLVRVRNRHGQTVSLLTHGDVLLATEGLGRALLQRLQDGAYPLRLGLGPGPLSGLEIWAAAVDGDRVVVVVPEAHGRIPGSLTPAPAHALTREAREAAGRVSILLLEPPAQQKGLPWFDERLTESLADLLVEMLTGPA